MESLSAPAADAAAADVSAPAATADADETALLKARVYALFEPKATDDSGEISRKELATKLRAGGQIESLLGIADGSTIPEVLHVMRILKKMETDQYGKTTISPQELQAMHSAVQRAAELVEAARRHIPQETLSTYAERMHAWVQTFNGASILLTALVAMVYTALSQREDDKCAVFPFLPENTTTTSYYLLARFVAVAGVIILSVVTIWYDLTLEVADPILERLENPAPADQKGQWWSIYETRFRSLVGVVAFVSLMFAVHSFHLVLQQGAATCTLINALPFAGALVAMHYAHRLLVGGNEAAPEKRETLSKQYWAESRVVSASMYYARASGYVDLSDDEENATTRQCCGTRLRPANAPTPKTTNALACCGCSRARCSLIWFSLLLAVALSLGQQLALQTRSQPSVAVRQITLEERHAIMRGITITPARRQLWDAPSSNISGLGTRVSRPVLTEMALPPEGNHLQRMGAPQGTTATLAVERRQLEAEIGSMADMSALQCSGAVIEVAPDTSELILRYTAITVGSVAIGSGLAVYAVTAAPVFVGTYIGTAMVSAVTDTLALVSASTAGTALTSIGASSAASFGVTTLAAATAEATGAAVATGAAATVVGGAVTAGAAGAAAAAGTTVVTSTVTSVGTAISVEQALVLGATELTVGVAGGGYVVGRGVSEMVDFVFGDPPQDSAEDACTLQPFVFNMREFDPDYDGKRSYTQRLVLATSADGLQDIVELVISPRTKMDMQTNPNVLRLGASPMEAQLVA